MHWPTIPRRQGGRIAFQDVISLVFLMRKSRLRFIASTWSSVTARVRTSDLQPNRSRPDRTFPSAKKANRGTHVLFAYLAGWLAG